MIPTVLITGGTAQEREQLIAEQLAPDLSAIALLEGSLPPSGTLTSIPNLATHLLTGGCPCCAGNLVLKVTLNRAIRSRPEQLFISLRSPAHSKTLIALLQDPSYAGHLNVMHMQLSSH